jgi:ribose transport system substrate-binding protein
MEIDDLLPYRAEYRQQWSASPPSAAKTP